MSFDKFLTKVFGSSNQRFLKSIIPLVEKINSLEHSVQALSDDELRARTAAFKERVQQAVGGDMEIVAGGSVPPADLERVRAVNPHVELDCRAGVGRSVCHARDLTG